MRLEDMDVRPESVLDITPAEADLMRAKYEFAIARDAAVVHHAERADLERRAKTDPEAAFLLLQDTFRRYNQAVIDGTPSEKRGWKEELRKACAHYNALTGRVGSVQVGAA